MTGERKTKLAYLAAGFGLALGLQALGQSVKDGTRYVSSGDTELRMLLDAAKLGGPEVEVGEITLPAKLDSGEHSHGSVEVFYVLSGELEHVVNGTSYILKPGMLGFVRPTDKVRHRVPSESPAKALVIWAPGGEAGRVTSRWHQAAEEKR